jgi:hypothetical protein
MTRQLLKDTILWGFLLWFFGYILGFVFFAFVPQNLLGWAIMPFGLAITFWVLFKKIKSNDFRDYLTLAVVWTIMSVLFDYFFLVKLLNPADGYYKLDVYLYYLLTFLTPLMVGWFKTKRS